MLPPHLRAHLFFATSAWISAAAFAALLAQPRSDVVNINGAARRIKGPKRAGALVSRFVIELDEDDSDESDLFDESDAVDASLKRKRTLHLRL
ncbi:hypothetical protein AURDEDRAFT_112619 [Auricularia subglabra TFB-10046 SS5]|nr:hypothetical protein AURDEDRAFT_112619 [Auricularia subglabra TFB-10046 SS5]